MKKFAIALACIALAIGATSCKKNANDPDAIDLTKYNPQDAPSCWKVTTESKGVAVTEYVWANEYTVAAGAKLGLTAAKTEGVSVTYSWSTASATTEKECEDLNQD